MDADLQTLLAEHERDAGDASPRAAARRRAVAALRAADRLRSPAERFAAARILIASDDPAEVDAAHALALAALAGERRARRLAAAAYDRLRMLRGEPQKFGTQVAPRDGARALWPVDPATTDSERAKWDLPSLAELQRAAAEAR